MKSNLIMFLLGVLLCSFAAKADDTIILTSSNHILFSGVVDESSVAKAQIKLGQLSKSLPKSSTIYLVLDTPGGSVSAGNLFIDYAKSLPQNIKPICIFCASMGYHFFQSFGERLVYSSSTLMSHRAKLGGMSGQVPGELESRLNSIKRILNQMDEVAAKRVGLTTKAYQALIYDELWLDGASAVQTHHADRIAKIKCSQDLADATREETLLSFFGAVTITYSQCPLITGLLDAKLSQGHKFRNRDEALALVRKVKRSVMWSF